jgi:DNA polymerase-3 subunit alpha
MAESLLQNFNHLKIHTQYSICEGAVKIDDLQEYSKSNKIKSLGLCDTSNLCGALEFAEKISKSGSQPIIGTQINFKIHDTIGLLPLYALNETGYKNIIDLSSASYLNNDELSDPHVRFDYLLNNSEGVALFSGTVFGLFGKLFDKGKFTEIHDLYNKIKLKFGDRFYIEIQRHKDLNESGFEKFNLKKSSDLEIPIIATNEVYYLNKDMHEAHDALICIGNKTYVNEKNRLKLSDQHYFKNNSEMSELFADLPEALENNYNFPLRCNFRPLFSNPILPNISQDKGGDADEILKKVSIEGLKTKFEKVFNISANDIETEKKLFRLQKKIRSRAFDNY